MRARFNKHLTAIAVAASLGIALPVMANNTSNIVGSVMIESVQGLTATATNPETGYSRQISINPEGQFRFAQLPPGNYQVEIKRDGGVIATQTLRLSLGSNATPVFDLLAAGTEVIEISSARISAVDVSTTDSGLVVSEVELDKMPVARNLTAVSLLAPGVVQGDEGFGNTASFGGASVAENACYINGLEVTNTRQGLGCGSVPFEFYKEFQVKTGGYSAQFGRSTGGVINAVTKSGTNDWEFAATAYWQPSSLQSEGSYSRANGGTGRVFRDARRDENDRMEMTFSAAGPIIEDTLFVYALVNPRDVNQKFATDTGFANNEYSGITEFREREASGGDNLFWGAKLDWDINEDHRLSYFAYSDRSDTQETVYSFDANSGVISDAPIGSNLRMRGGEAQSLTYTGYLTDDLTVSAMAGEIETQYTTSPSNQDCPRVVDNRDVANPAHACGPGTPVGDNYDKNTQYRLDIEYFIGSHTLRLGADVQDRESYRVTTPVAGHSWTYDTLSANGSIQGNNGALYTNSTGAPLDYVSDRIFVGGGAFSSDLTAYYFEDKWQITDTVLLTLGARKDEFEGLTPSGSTLYKFDTGVAPRLGVSWDVNGDGDSKLYATWGRYYLPVANNTIYRAAAGINDATTYYTFTGIDSSTGAPTGISPVTGSAVSSTVTNSVATIPQQPIFQAQEADPFAKDELIVGYERVLTEELSMSVRGTFREVTSALDDYCGFYAYPYCVLLNPGEASSWYKDGYYWNGQDFVIDRDLFDGIPDEGSLTTHSVDTLGLPEAKNEYLALQTGLKYQAEDLRLNFIYTWSRSTGNFEGAVKSDIDQADAGITQDFDSPALMDGADGYQPNDRRHVFKLFGSYDISDDWSMGFNATLASGRPLSAFGQGYPSDDPDVYGSYGDTFYLFTGQCPDSNGNGACDQEEKVYNFVPRGTVGRTPWTFNVDMSLAYHFNIQGVEMRASLDLFNVLNSQAATALNEHFESSEGTENQWYGAAYSWQQPRYVRLGVEARF
ncbi:TonB-dependent receptor [Bowmanella dokdonensis]|uniref:TonB-dependent receptor n=1 Tax=Bowmanella dokdonensis TaxID=751969 RepID=A0A939DMI9_9ALTE|nr:TonB-dependent receptor [Bowmanella dokdonensis]MBN7825335.1 TonB-dependent receptor [Bowmanella dokdonensis]